MTYYTILVCYFRFNLNLNWNNRKNSPGELVIQSENGERRTLRSTPDWTDEAVNGDHLWVPTSASGDLCYVTDPEGNVSQHVIIIQSIVCLFFIRMPLDSILFCLLYTYRERDRGWSALGAGSSLTFLAYLRWSFLVGPHSGTGMCASIGRIRPPVIIGFTAAPKRANVKTVQRLINSYLFRGFFKKLEIGFNLMISIKNQITIEH